jgi:hypothetical protein
MDATTSIVEHVEEEEVRPQANRSRSRVRSGAGPALVVTLATGRGSIHSAFVAAHGWADTFGTDVRSLELSEKSDGHRRTLGARSRRLAASIAARAEGEGADVIVLGIDRRRLGSRRVAPSLRDQLTKLTALPVLVAGETEDRAHV